MCKKIENNRATLITKTAVSATREPYWAMQDRAHADCLDMLY